MKWGFLILTTFVYNFNCLAQSVDLTTYLPDNYVMNGSVDYTEYLQNGLNQNVEVTFPNFPVLINEKGLKIREGQILNFHNNSCLIMKPNSNERYSLLNLVNVHDVVINNPNLIGDREDHLGNTGEWGMGINILSSSNIVINKPNISKFWGDGIYIGEILHKDRSKYGLSDYSSKEIVINGGVLDYNRRNGVSVISVKGLKIDGTVIQNTDGVLPMAGLCIEPNNNEQFLENIEIRNVVTRNNKEVGIKYVTSSFFGQRKKNVSVLIEDCTDYGAKLGLYIGGARASYKRKIERFDGTITVKNFTSHSNETPVRFGSIQRYSPKIKIQSFLVYSKNKRDYNKERKVNAELRAKKFLVN